MATGAHVRVLIQEKQFASMPGPLFRDLAFDVAPSSVVALLGRSGVGKSSLLRIIAGIDREFSGELRIDGKPAHQAPTPGFVFQDPRLLPWASAIDNILAVSPETGAAKASEFLAGLGLAGFEDALPHQLSGGMQRRVALARALAVQPKLLLLDEPFVSIDRKLASELQDVVVRIVEVYKPTVILVTHDAEDAVRLADRVVILSGTPARIVEDRGLKIARDARSAAEIAMLGATLRVETGAAE